MPQLMPLMWVFSFAMWFIVVFVLINMYYYMYTDNIDCLMSNLCDFKFNMEW